MIITENVHCISTFFTNQYLIVDGHTLFLIDTGLRGNAAKIIRSIYAIGHHPSALKQTFITHADGDHYGAANGLIKSTGCRIAASRLEAEAMITGSSSRELKPKGIFKHLLPLTDGLFRADPTNVDTVLEPGLTLPILEGLKVLSTPGHTPDHISFYLPKYQILFAGDSIWLKNQAPCPSRGMNTWDIELSDKSFQAQMALNPSIICAGHGILKLH